MLCSLVGFDAPPGAHDDIEESDVVVLIGTDLCVAHPILWGRVLCSRYLPQIVVIDPRRTETAAASNTHIGLLPQTELYLLYGLAHLLIENGWIDHAADADTLAAQVKAFTPEVVSTKTGISVDTLQSLAHTIHYGERVSFWWALGDQSHENVRIAQAIIDLALLTGNTHRPGTGAHFITRDCNAIDSAIYTDTVRIVA